MFRTVITPEQQNISIHLPINFVGKKVEVLLYILEEVEEPQDGRVTTKKKPSDFFGTLSREDGEKMQAYITQSRNEWERNF